MTSISQEQPEPEDPYAGATVPIVLAFEGGGARGIVHVAALQEIENSNPSDPAADRTTGYSRRNQWPRYQIFGLAGTSIGALVAALRAVGYTSRDMVDRTAEGQYFSNVLEIAGFHPHDPLSAFTGWNRLKFRLLRLSLRWPPVTIVLLWLAWLLLSVFAIGFFPDFVALLLAGLSQLDDIAGAISLLLQGHSQEGIVSIPLLRILHQSYELFDTSIGKIFQAFGFPDKPSIRYDMAVIWTINTVILLTIVRCALRGVCSLRRLANGIDRALSVRLLNPSVPAGELARVTRNAPRQWFRLRYRKRVRFRDIPQPLRMAAVDMSTRQLKVFSRSGTPDAFVADAVAASMAIPVLFKPYRMRDEDGPVFYCDGGLISNLPTWTFDSYLEHDPDLHILGIEIRSPQERLSSTEQILRATAEFLSRVFLLRWFLRPFRNAGHVLSATIFGGKEMEVRRGPRTVLVATRPNVDLMRFDLSNRDVDLLMNEGRRRFQATMSYRSVRRRLMNYACFKVAGLISGDKQISPQHRIRVSLLRPTRSGARVLRTAWLFSSDGSTFLTESDDQLLYPFRLSDEKGNLSDDDDSIPGFAWRTGERVLASLVDEHGKFQKSLLVRPQSAPGGMPAAKLRYTHPWAGQQWCLVVRVLRDAGAPSVGVDGWAIKVDSNIPLSEFGFGAGTGDAFDQIASGIETIGGEFARNMAFLKSANDAA